MSTPDHDIARDKFMMFLGGDIRQIVTQYMDLHGIPRTQQAIRDIILEHGAATSSTGAVVASARRAYDQTRSFCILEVQQFLAHLKTRVDLMVKESLDSLAAEAAAAARNGQQP